MTALRRPCLSCRRVFEPTGRFRSRCPSCTRVRERLRNRKRQGSARVDIPKLVKQRDNYRCVRCGSATNLEAHHMVPVAAGGTHEIENLVTLCRRCHQEIHDAMRRDDDR